MNNDPLMNDPGFDARLEYNSALGELMRALSIFSSNGQYDAWRRTLTQLVNVNPYLSAEERADCDKKIYEAVHYLELSNTKVLNPRVRLQLRQYTVLAERRLNDATRTVFDSMKRHDMLLPKSSNNDDFSEKSVETEMGL